jgi:two-component system chemotaxis sensor kinase CheA
MQEFKDRFIADALELLAKIEKSLLMLEVKPDNILIVEEIFRGLHSLKGASGMYGFNKIGKLMHLIENVYDDIRDGKLKVDTEIVNLSLDVVDFTNNVLRLGEDVSDSTVAEFEKIEGYISNYLGQNDHKIEEEEPVIVEEQDSEKTYYVNFTLDEAFETRGIQLDSIFKELDELGSAISIPLKKEDGKPESWEIFIVSKSSAEDIEDVFIFMMDITSIELLANENLFKNDEFNSVVQKNSALKQKNNLEELQNIIQKKKVVEEVVETPSKKEKEKVEEKVEEQGQEEGAKSSINYLRVSAEKLDEQMDLLSELVTAKAELRLIVEKEGYKKLFKLLESIDKTTNRFRKNILNVRLVQIKTLYIVFLRLVRDISRKLGKNVEFIAEGLETELDKNIIDALESPLTHIIRNSLDHGVEPAEEREKTGKPAKAMIKFNTFRSGSDIIIEIIDDGRGMDKVKIRKKAIDKGIITPDTELTDKQLYDLIFLPGFSTAQNLSEVSGRGVGMDVVKRSISQLRGDVEISSSKGKGTTVSIRLPMSLSIIDTLLVQTGNQYFAIPLPSIHKCTQLLKEDLEQTANNQLNIEEKLVPYIYLRDMFLINGNVPERQRVVIVSNETQEVGLVVDKVIGEYQAVLKPFDGYLINQKYLTGASLLADGQLCVILDVNKLIDSSKKQKELHQVN